MKTFDLPEVRGFAADLDARLSRCDNGEGLACANLDDTLQHYAEICCRFRDGVRQWGRAVFTGQVAFDPEVERVWLDKGWELCDRAMGVLACGVQAEDECFVLNGNAALRAALWDLCNLLNTWVTPKLSVGPSARQGLSSSVAEEARKRVSSLPPRPADWRPDAPALQNRYAKLRPRTS